LDFYHLPVVSGRLGSAHIEIGTGQNQLTVEGGKKQEREYLYRGIFDPRHHSRRYRRGVGILDPLKMEATTLKSNTACTPGGLDRNLVHRCGLGRYGQWATHRFWR